MNVQPKVMFYVQHLLGIGHLARASRISAALAADGFDVTVVTGGTPVAGFPGAGVAHVALPAIVSGDAGFSGLTDIDGNPVDDAFKAQRRDLLLQTFAKIRPDIVIIEAFPFGRRQVRFELLPLLDAIHAMQEHRPLVLTSLRDILQERSKPGRDEETIAIVQTYFDGVLVHGDPNFARLEETFPLAEQIRDKIFYTGLVAAPEDAPKPTPAGERFDIVVSAGGGAVGRDLIRAASTAAAKIRGHSWCLITGPNLPQADFEAIAAQAPDGVNVFRFRQDFATLLAGAKLSVSQAGYNTVCDILRAGCRSLLIPFTTGGETEQSVRAERLERLDLACMLPEEKVATDMRCAIADLLGRPEPLGHRLDLEGATRTAGILREWLERPDQG
jgi:predicted glycosyltransferase